MTMVVNYVETNLITSVSSVEYHEKIPHHIPHKRRDFPRE
jgi:hypothetical protein